MSNYNTKKLQTIAKGLFELIYVYECFDAEDKARYEQAVIELDKRGITVI
jgi:hypothetical protein